MQLYIKILYLGTVLIQRDTLLAKSPLRLYNDSGREWVLEMGCTVVFFTPRSWQQREKQNVADTNAAKVGYIHSHTRPRNAYDEASNFPIDSLPSSLLGKGPYEVDWSQSIHGGAFPRIAGQ